MLEEKRMTSGSKKKRWGSVLPSCFMTKRSSLCFCLFSKVKSDDDGAKTTPVCLNVYDLTPMNGYVYWTGMGIFHCGVEVHGVEYAFGAHDYSSSGIFEVEPRQCPGFKFRKSIYIGATKLDASQVREFMEGQSGNYNGDTYHLIVKNCNHFCKDMCYKLTGKKIPKWVNRLARMGSMFRCFLPEPLKTRVVQPCVDSSSEKRRLSGFSFLSSVSSRQKNLSASSLLIQPPSEVERVR